MHHFPHFRQLLDADHDARERVIRASRDITNIAKKAIFALHRDPPAFDAVRDSLAQVDPILAALAQDISIDRYQRQISPGVQEYIEAISFAHYLEHRTLIPFDLVQRALHPHVTLTVSDFLLGLSDLTGELMRLAISGITHEGGRNRATEICAFVRACKADFERFTPYVPELRKKQKVTAQSLQKIEDAAYAIVVRISEYDLSPEMLDDIVARSVAPYETRSDDSRRFGPVPDDED